MLAVAVLVLTGGMPHVAHAASLETRITGIAGLSGRPTKGVTVWSVCNGHKQHAVAPTDAKGRYLIVFAATDCPVGSLAMVKVHVQLSFGSFIGDYTVTIAGEVTTLDIVVPDNIAVPEYGWPAAIATFGASVGAVAFWRKRLLARPSLG